MNLFIKEPEYVSSGNQTEQCQVLRCKNNICQDSSLELIGEEPFLIRIDDKPYSVVMRTPGDERFHAAGFCLGEGIADSPDDFMTIGYDQNLDPNVIDIWLTPDRRKRIHSLLDRRGFISQTSCGICGKEMIKDLHQTVMPVENGFEVGTGSVFKCFNQLFDHQEYYPKTRGAHAAILFDEDLEMVAFAEDVGRHNALDKVVGKAFMNRSLSRARLLVLSSRLSYELVQKAARARLPVMVSKSRPTALAVKMGKALNMTLAVTARESELIIICGDHRIRQE